ncbi:bifunctional folylpolyglutamate synthase/dihydrofolate synthase [Oceanobacillus halotolerans]|uniref:bifunctional folylpolyglutamate synthase/dihydrofolate synthase n=1 Tax=Oceanobacillus halotolerans TaxID=2663380 RepID=UPI0013D99D47|nr:Mur ligase family protein [Oceanobacillus halotolerans]
MFTSIEEVETFFENRASLGIKPGLTRIIHLLHLLGDPQETIKAIHIAGTNGKGSTANFLSQALAANGYRVGIFTSPSLAGRRGHILDNNTLIDEDTFISLLNTMLPAINELDQHLEEPSEFEIITALAFLYFSQHVEIALIEAGMGGREDTTNCLTPLFSIITNVELDHTHFLGGTIQEIAYQKAGIIKHQTPVIIGSVYSTAFQVIQKEAFIKEAPLYALSHDFSYSNRQQELSIQRYSWHDEKHNQTVRILAQGKHQVENSAVAIKGLFLLQSEGYHINWEYTLKRLSKVTIPGRYEQIYTDPVIIADSAHNPAGMELFVETVEEIYPAHEKHLLFAAFQDKDIQTMLQMVDGHFSTVTITTFNHKRAATLQQLENMQLQGEQDFTIDWRAKLQHFLKGDKDAIYFVTGSFHFITEVRKYMSLL